MEHQRRKNPPMINNIIINRHHHETSHTPKQKCSMLNFLLHRLLPFTVVLLALFVGWLNQGPMWEGRFFATLIPSLKGRWPPLIVGHGKMSGTPPVPADMMPAPRPEREFFLELPGGYKMPQNGLGMCCRPTAYDDVCVERSVLWYLLMGGRHIDGAHLYLNHEAIGRGIREAMFRGVPRDEIFVTTKIWPSHYGRNRTLETVPIFLKELGVEYMDMVLMHAPGRYVGNPSSECRRQGLSNSECRKQTFQALSELREQGLIRNVGVSNFVTPQIKELQEIPGAAPVANNQIQFNPWLTDEWVETAQYCKDQGIAITGYNSLGGTFQHHEAHTIKVLTNLATKYEKSVAQIMLRWAMQKGTVVIPGTGNPKHMKENLAVYDMELSEEDMQAIDELRNTDEAKKFLMMDSNTWEKVEK
jgi:diketogulonate reductase-like aldo/keto reductase